MFASPLLANCEGGSFLILICFCGWRSSNFFLPSPFVCCSERRASFSLAIYPCQTRNGSNNTATNNINIEEEDSTSVPELLFSMHLPLLLLGPTCRGHHGKSLPWDEKVEENTKGSHRYPRSFNEGCLPSSFNPTRGQQCFHVTRLYFSLLEVQGVDGGPEHHRIRSMMVVGLLLLLRICS